MSNLDCGLSLKDIGDIRRMAGQSRKRRERRYLTVAERIRFKYWLWWKYGPECGYCHRLFDWRHGLTIDHIQPKSRGGSVRDVRNMVLACMGCNRAKGNQWPVNVS